MPGLTYKTDDNGRRYVKVSQSWLNTFFNCPELARQQAFEGLIDGGSDATAMGTGLHSGAETHLLHGGNLADCIEAAVASFRHETTLPGFRWIQVKGEATALKYIDTLVTTWWNDVRPRLGAPVAVEWGFRTFLFTYQCRDGSELDVYLSGALDYVDDLGIIWDWKTANDAEKYGKRKGWEFQRWSIQPTSYSKGWFDATGEYAPFIFATCLKGNTPKPAQFTTVSRNEQHWAWLQRQIEPIIDLADSDLKTWPLRDQHVLCSPKWCPAWDTCKGALVDM